MDSKELISYKDVDICYGENTVLNGINMQVLQGDFIYLMGRVGSGKSSFLKSLYAEIPVSGDARIFDYDLPKIKRKHIPFLRRKMGIIFQDFQLLPDRNVFDNLAFVLKATGWKNKEAIDNQVIHVLSQVGMGRKAKLWPHQLSGGEQQRIAIARALLNSPELILADEPTGNLDTETGHQLISLLYDIHKAGTSVIIATHNLRWVAEFPGRVFHCETEKLKEDNVETSDIGEEGGQPMSTSEIEEINVPAEELSKVVDELNAKIGEEETATNEQNSPEKTGE